MRARVADEKISRSFQTTLPKAQSSVKMKYDGRLCSFLIFHMPSFMPTFFCESKTVGVVFPSNRIADCKRRNSFLCLSQTLDRNDSVRNDSFWPEILRFLFVEFCWNKGKCHLNKLALNGFLVYGFQWKQSLTYVLAFHVIRIDRYLALGTIFYLFSKHTQKREHYRGRTNLTHYIPHR